ncbi:MAG: 1-acyl-sn-glycerol-3-phosphate acyltransferase, partial [Treponema sp.]|nr:1-acyl-sn-glycerol-3-phosphate acyltransferase [Treponema sp.]
MEKESVRKMSLKERYGESFKKLASLSVAAAKIDSTNVYQEENPTTRKIMDALVEDNTLPESHLEGTENFEKFYDEVCAGKRGLILMEHYSNTDLPAFCYMLEHSGKEKLS